MCSLSKEQYMLSRETIQNAFFLKNYAPFDLEKTLTFCNISVITEDIYLKHGICVHYPKSNTYYQGRQFKIHFFKNYAPFDLEKTLTFCNISVITEDIWLKRGICVHYPKSNLEYQGRQFKMHFLQNYALFWLRKL